MNDLSLALQGALPAPQTAAMAEGAVPLHRAAQTLLKSLSRGQALSPAVVRDAMTAAFGGPDSSGAWVWKDAYDAVEAAQVLFLRTYLPAMRRKARHRSDVLEMLAKVADLCPTHTKRSEESAALQQFSTPLQLAFLVAEAALLTPADVVLEPSAGTGMLAVHAELAGAELVLNEYAEDRADLLGLLFPSVPVTNLNAEQLHDRLDDGVLPSVVLMNPPFSASPHVTGAIAGMDLRHVRSALARLAPGGRLVAITSEGLHPGNQRWAVAFEEIAKVATLQLSVPLTGAFFKRHGTGIETRLTIIDKLPTPEGHLPVLERIPCSTPGGLAATLSAYLPLRLPVFPHRSAVAVAPVPVAAPPSTVAVPVATPLAPVGVSLAYSVIDDAAPRLADDGLYQAYAPERIRFVGAKSHPTKLVQSAAMASVLPPVPTYLPHLPECVVTDGLLSDAQLESVVYAGEAHAGYLTGRWMVSDSLDALTAAADDNRAAVQFRRGWFLGDGTGAGKGRQVAGILLDNWLKGRRKALWVSKSDKLLEDAQRDWSALGQEKLLIVPQDRWKQGKAISLPEGILFTTYATLRSVERSGKASRLQQILDWLGDGFDGVIVFDESHAMGNAGGGISERGAVKASQQGVAGLRLQHALPEARVVYVSATGATTVENLAYAQRLGLWGAGDLPFETRSAFVSAMHAGGIASAEVLARDLKSLGLYMARSLSYDGIVVDILEHALTPAQVAIYDAYAGGYQVIHQNLDAAMAAAGITSEDGVTRNTMAKSAARSAFESNKQRFFNHLITAMKMPSLIRAIEADLAASKAAVVQLVSTSEALMDRRLAEIPPSEWRDLAFDITPREYVLHYLRHSFPVTLYETYTDETGKLQARVALDADGRAIVCREAEAARDGLIEHLSALPPVQAALDQLIHHFGADAVAEVTGRSRRIVRLRDGASFRLVVRSRPASANLGETQAFMDDKKRILVFSDAGGTGRSYHADLGCRNQRPRVHYLLEPGWKADAAIQGLGRSNRTNQAHPPLFRPVATDVRGERRFISTIARRLDSLGAITRGQRQTGGQGMFRPSDNLESTYARDALRQFYRLLHSEKIACCSLARFMEVTGLRLLDGDGTLREDLPPISTFLNRMLALQIDLQNALFAVFEAILEGRVESAIAAGTYEVGLETIVAERLTLRSRHVVATHAASGAVTELLEVERRDRNRPLTLQAVTARAAASETVLLHNAKSRRVALQVPAPSVMLDDGNVEERVRLLRPMEHHAFPLAALADTSWEPCDPTLFAQLWQAEVDAVPEFSDSTFHVVSGLLLPIWKALPEDNPRIYRFTAADGLHHIGRLVPPGSLDAFGVDEVPRSVGMALERLKAGRSFALSAHHAVKPVRVMHEERFELIGISADELPRLKALGCFTEIIAWRTRVFVPTGAGAETVLQQLITRYQHA